MEQLVERILIAIAPALSGISVSTIALIVYKKYIVPIIKKKVDNIDSDIRLKKIDNKLESIEKEIMEMRGKRK